MPSIPPAVADSLRAALAEAGTLMAAGRSADAISRYRRGQALLGLHLTYDRPDEFYYEESAALNRGLAEAYLAAGDAHAARIEAERGLNVAPADARLWTLLGLARYRTADPGPASEALRRALALDPRAADAHWGLALVAVAANRLAEARGHAARAVELDPRPRYALDLARWAALDGDYAAAARALGAAEGRAGAAPPGLRGFYEALSRGPVQRPDRPLVRGQVNFELVPGDEVPYVPVRFGDGPPVYILFDTGAAWNVIDRDFARSIGLDPVWPGGPLAGPYGATAAGWTVAPRLEIGSVGVERVPFAVADLGALGLRGQGAWRPVGVVNPALLFRDHTVVFDYRHRRIEIHRYGAGEPGYAGRATRQRKAVTPLLLDANGVWPVIPVRLDGSRELPFILDTGASDVLVDRSTVGALRLEPRGVRAEAGGHVAVEIRPLLLDRPPGDPEGIEVRGILGYPFFRGKRLAFDYRDMVLTIED